MNHRGPWQTVIVAALAASGAGLASTAQATEYGTVVSSTPVWTQVAVPRRECLDEQVQVQPRSSGGGAIAGAIIGGVVGNTIGSGGGRAAATALGAVAGAALGDQAEQNSQPPATRTVQRCRRVSETEDRLVGYDVVYEYGGVQRSARMDRDPGGPGARIAMDVSVRPSGAAEGTAPSRASRGPRVGTPVPSRGAQGEPPRDEYDDTAEAPRVYGAPYATPYAVAPVVVPYAVYPAYPAYAPGASIYIGGVWGGGHHGHYRRW
jgi:uncharacterized protein YcfJ